MRRIHVRLTRPMLPSRQLIRSTVENLSSWDRVVIYYDNGQRELTNLVHGVFNAHLTTVEVRKVVPARYSLFQVTDL